MNERRTLGHPETIEAIQAALRKCPFGAKIRQEYRSLRGNRAEPPEFHNWNSIESTESFFPNHLLSKKSRIIKIGRRIHFQIISCFASRNLWGACQFLRLDLRIRIELRLVTHMLVQKPTSAHWYAEILSNSSFVSKLYSGL